MGPLSELLSPSQKIGHVNMPLVVGGICRFAINQRFMGRDVVNILDVHIDLSTLTDSREDAIVDQGKIIARQWKADVMPDLVNDLTIESVSWVDLNAEDGTTGAFAGDGGDTLPSAGGVDNDPSSSNVAILVTKNTNSGRGSKSGRMYVCGLPEAYTSAADPNHISEGFRGTLQGNFDSFLSNVNQEGGGELVGYDSEIVVVHVPRSGDPSATKVNSFAVQSLLATQRHRLRG
jgi:hypothetical protein